MEKKIEKLLELAQQQIEELRNVLGEFDKGNISAKEINSKMKIYDKSAAIEGKILKAIKRGADNKEIKGLYGQIEELRKKLNT